MHPSNKYFSSITKAEFGEICKAIKGKFKDDHFPFKHFTEKEVDNVFLKLPTNEASISNNILLSISKQSMFIAQDLPM